MRDEDGEVEKREARASEATDSNKTRGEGGKQDIKSESCSVWTHREEKQ